MCYAGPAGRQGCDPGGLWQAGGVQSQSSRDSGEGGHQLRGEHVGQVLDGSASFVVTHLLFRNIKGAAGAHHSQLCQLLI